MFTTFEFVKVTSLRFEAPFLLPFSLFSHRWRHWPPKRNSVSGSFEAALTEQLFTEILSPHIYSTPHQRSNGNSFIPIWNAIIIAVTPPPTPPQHIHCLVKTVGGGLHVRLLSRCFWWEIYWCPRLGGSAVVSSFPTLPSPLEATGRWACRARVADHELAAFIPVFSLEHGWFDFFSLPLV